MHAEVVAVGDELTSGQRLDTNSRWLSERLGEIGVRVLYHVTVGDELTPGTAVVREAINRSDLIITTGGLGPTADDLTRQAIAAATETDLVLDEPSLQHIRALFARRGRVMPEQNVVQARFPRGARAVPNPHGTAPGVAMVVQRPGRDPARLFALPGVPAEMRQMWDASVRDTIVLSLGKHHRVIRHRCIKCFGVGESDMERMLPDLIRRGRRPSVGITVSQATITLRVTADGRNEQECADAMAPTIGEIHRCVGDLAFGYDDDELQHAVLRLLQRNHQTLFTAEWDAGGLLASWLSGVDQQAKTYLGGLVLRTPATATQLLPELKGMDNEFEFRCRQITEAVARQCQQQSRADYALAVSPFPESAGQQREDQLVHIALATPARVIVESKRFAGHPDIVGPRAIKQALDLLRHELK